MKTILTIILILLSIVALITATVIGTESVLDILDAVGKFLLAE